VLRTLYFDLTGDTSTTNTISKEIEECLRIMMQLEDPSIVIDLCTNNGFKGKKFDVFWDEMETKIHLQLIIGDNKKFYICQ